ncbi:Peptide methionine sulfoxide reductase MsrA [Methylibium sp. T29]|nr:Peptide methionine sulfoxide reductase MsrA [Methylibium sp. T29]EWS59118.1 Peptide methionine sulfoxide reductase MsrA [Methylibium sp. T29-B]
MNTSANLETATLGGGCFWCTEAVFQEVDGVVAVESGYSNGHVNDPSYEQVCGGETGHAEVIRVQFDPQRIGFRELLEIFFVVHDPTTPNRQATTSARSTARASTRTATSRRASRTRSLPSCRPAAACAARW